MEIIWDYIERDKDGIDRYNPRLLNLITECQNDDALLRRTSQSLIVGVTSLRAYTHYFKKLQEYFDLGCSIIELGFGDFPIMSYLIDQEQKRIQRGQIIAYDGWSKAYQRQNNKEPWKSQVVPLGNIQYNFSNITEDTILPPYDLIFGIKTCRGLIDLVNRANQDGKDFFLVPCDCYPPDITDYLYNLAATATDEEHELIIDDSFDKKYPILTRKRKKTL